MQNASLHDDFNQGQARDFNGTGFDDRLFGCCHARWDQENILPPQKLSDGINGILAEEAQCNRREAGRQESCR